MSDKYCYCLHECCTRRTLEVLLPHLQRAADAPFEEDVVQTELKQFVSAATSMLQEGA